MKKKLLLMMIGIISISAACSEDTYNAYKMTIEEVKQSEGYYWFDDVYQEYNPIDSLLPKIQQAFNQDEHKIIIFVAPSCDCGSDYKKFPSLIKIFDEAGISEQNYEIYSVGENYSDYSHPYQDLIHLQRLPSFVILRNASPIYSINDTIVAHGEIPVPLEPYLYEGLK